MEEENILGSHIEELKKELIDEGIDEDSILMKQIVRLTRLTINQHHEINKLKEELD